MSFLSRVLAIALVFFSVGVLAQEFSDELIPLTFDGTSKASNAPEATREVMQDAMHAAARDQVIQFLGDKKYQKNRALIEKKIISESVKFIPISNMKRFGPEPDGSFKGTVDMKLSAGSLKKLILSTGLLVDSEEIPSLLPLVRFHDGAKMFAWWGKNTDEDRKALPDWVHLLDSNMASEMAKTGFFVLKPSANLSGLVPDGFRSETLSKTDSKFLSYLFNSNLVAVGDVTLKPLSSTNSELVLKITISQSSNDREIAEVARTVEIEKSNFPQQLRAKIASIFQDASHDLAVQVLDSWQKGTLGSASIRFAVRGLLSPRQVQDFKNEIRKSVREIKSLKERIFEPGQVVFDMDYLGSSTQMIDHLKVAKVESFDYRFVESSDKLIRAEVRSTVPTTK